MNLNKDSSQLFAFSRYRNLNTDEKEIISLSSGMKKNTFVLTNRYRKPNKTDLDFIKEKKESLR